MSETKEIPAEMIRAATAAMLTRAGYNKHDYPEAHQPTNARWIATRKDATAILEAAGVAEMAESVESEKRITALQLARIKNLEAELKTFREFEALAAGAFPDWRCAGFSRPGIDPGSDATISAGGASE